jgi:predicted RNA-binding protein with PIN domain
MSPHIIIDGYNLIRQSRRFKSIDRQDIERGRLKLLEELTAYKKKKRHRITVVFDGANAPVFSQRQDRIGGIDIRFSSTGDSADSLIKKMAARERDHALVVSSDRDIVGFARSQGAAVIGSLDFADRIAQAADVGHFDLTAEGWRNPSTKKKGPSRRLSKRERKNNLQTGKL